jgi:nicotinic acid phosphoribosyltransferase
MFTPNPMILCDFYKISHRLMYPKGMQICYSTWTPRLSRIEGITEVVAFGFQAFVKSYLIDYFQEYFFKQNIDSITSEYKEIISDAIGDLNPGTSHIEALHKLGYLPIKIKAVKEGTLIPIRCPMLTIENTLPEFFWLTNYLETIMSNYLWMPITSATLAHQYRKILDKNAIQTTGSTNGVQFQAHDFSFRGMAMLEAASASGAGHLLSFVGSDTIPAISYLKKYYNAKTSEGLISCSVPASEHSIMSSYGSNELEAFKRLITEIHPSGFVSIVSDTYSYFDVLTQVLPQLKDIIMDRDGRVVIRPDCYDDQTSILTPNGWKLFSELTEDDLVAQVLEDETYQFVKPIKHTVQDYEGDMIHFFDEKEKLDLLVTPNHRMIFKKNGDLKVQEANICKVGIFGKNMLRTASASNKNQHITPFERLKIAFQADGSFCTGSKCAIRFSFSKQRKIDRMKDILEECKLAYKIYDLADKRFEFHIQADSSLFQHDFAWINTSDLCSQWCQEFIEECSYWDATRRSIERFKFDTTDKFVSDIVELITIGAGYGVLTTVSQDDRKEIFSDVNTLHILKNNLLGGQSQQKKVVPYKGKVYCVQVPSGMVLVKRNRCTLVSGNSGVPEDIVCGDKSAPVGSPEYKGTIELLWEIFGGTVTEQGYKVLDSHIGCIYGDAITIERCHTICARLEFAGFASTNMVYGIGSYTYQYNTRDTFGFALKSTFAVIDGVETPIFKDPKTDSGNFKKSQKGMVVVLPTVDGGVSFIDEQSLATRFSYSKYDLLEDIFVDGKLLRDETLADIRARLATCT